MLNISGTYHFPVLNIQRVLSYALRDWQIGVVMEYASGVPILAPAAQTQLNTVFFTGNSFASRVSGQPLFTQDLNCHCFDPLTTFVLNPKAWVNPPTLKVTYFSSCDISTFCPWSVATEKGLADSAARHVDAVVLMR